MSLFRRQKHATRRNAAGQSCRQRAFKCFVQGARPSQVFKTIGIPARTAYRYFEDYKKLHNRLPYSQIRRWMKESPKFSEKVIDLLAASLDMSREEVVTRMQKPWSLHQAMRGEWPNYKLDRDRTVIEDRLLAALEIVNFADKFGKTNPKMVRDILRQLIVDRDEEPEDT